MTSLLLGIALASPVDTLLDDLRIAESDRETLRETGQLFRYDRMGLGLDDDNADGTREAGVSMQVIEGTPDEIWPHVVDCDRYVSFLPYVTGSTRSNFEETEDGATWTCAMELTTKGFVTRYAVDTTWIREEGRATFGMTEGSGNVLKAADGFWQTLPWDDDHTLLVYVFESRAAWWVPGFAKRLAAERGLSDVTRLIGRQVQRARPVADEAK